MTIPRIAGGRRAAVEGRPGSHATWNSIASRRRVRARTRPWDPQPALALPAVAASVPIRKPSTLRAMSRSGAPLARLPTLAVVTALPLAAWPGLETPFSTPKLWLLACGVALCSAIGWRSLAHTREGRWHSALPSVALPLWLASWALSALLGDVVSLAALWLGVGAALWALILLRMVGAPLAVMRAQVAGVTGVALVAVSQWVGLDPFAWLGWFPAIAGASPRLAVYGTLGNPNFVGCLLAGTLPLAAGLLAASGRALARSLAVAALVIQVAALFATGSRAGALGTAAAAIAAAVLSRDGRLRVLAAAGLAVAALLVLSSPARPLADTLSGRLYIWRVTSPHAFDRPLAGFGPGAFEVRYPGWEVAARATGQAQPADRPFEGPQQHAHNDYLEALVERGTLGLFALLAVVLSGLAVAWSCARHPSAHPTAIAAAASLAALSAAALVDFPLARPAEAVNFWTAVAIIAMDRRQQPNVT